MPSLEIIPLAFESLGVRSCALSVNTDDVKIVIDPAVALAPNRFSLPPHPMEKEEKERLWASVKKHVDAADVLVVTHYHYDHVEPKEPGLYEGKIAILKHPQRMINPSQRRRAASFIKSIKGIVGEICYTDKRSYRFGDTEVSFSAPVPHGFDATRGYVVEVCVEAGETFLYTSDVQGPQLEEHVKFIQEKKPETLFVDGPSTYFDSPFSDFELVRAIRHLIKILRGEGVERLVIDHHLARDLEYRVKISPVIEAGEEVGVWVGVAAEFLDIEPNLLEARRRELYKEADN
ncbi:MAG: hypothetical protein PVH79_00540 [Candidatus Bathyarchaeota archaeon]|jgi:predicted metallo-beta-lactamase superfamily hydrolase